MPQDSHWLASFEVIPPPETISFSAAKMKIPHAENGTMRTPTFEKKISDPIFFFFFFGFFCRNFVTPMSTLANNKSAPLLKKWKISAQKCVSPIYIFPAKDLARFCHAVLDFTEHQGLPPD